jgi:hypothetical protein
MAGLDPAIHALLVLVMKRWMPRVVATTLTTGVIGERLPGHDKRYCRGKTSALDGKSLPVPPMKTLRLQLKSLGATPIAQTSRKKPEIGNKRR